ncbi:hypothetical protein ACQY0O_000258 [Thecaphora frezii]
MTAAPSSAAPQGVEILTISNVRATQYYDGEEVTLGFGPLCALLVSIDLQDANSASNTPTDKEKQYQQQHSFATDLWLVLAVGDNFSLPIPAFQSIKPIRNGDATSYVMASDDVEGASIRIALPPRTDKAESRRLEEILSQYAAYQDDDPTDKGAIELMDEQGHVLGVVQGQFELEEDGQLSESGHEKDPVLIDLAPEPKATKDIHQTMHVGVAPQPQVYEKGDWLLQGADFVSRNLIRGSEFIGTKINSAADNYTLKHPSATSSAPPYSGPIEKGPNSNAQPAGREAVKLPGAAQSGASTLYQLSGHAVQISSKTVGTIFQMASNVGDKIGKKTGIQRQVRPDGSLGPAPKGIRGFVNRSLIATNTVLDGIDTSTQTLLMSSGEAASKIVGHRYGEDARNLSETVIRTGRNVFLVYKDVRGVRRQALLKAAGGRALKAKLEDGSEVTINIDDQGRASTQGGAPTPPRTKSAASSSEKAGW